VPAKPHAEIADHEERSRSGQGSHSDPGNILLRPQPIADEAHDGKPEPDDALVRPNSHSVHEGRQREIACC